MAALESISAKMIEARGASIRGTHHVAVASNADGMPEVQVYTRMHGSHITTAKHNQQQELVAAFCYPISMSNFMAK